MEKTRNAFKYEGEEDDGSKKSPKQQKRYDDYSPKREEAKKVTQMSTFDFD